jgi:hypothetical protein
MRRRVSSGGWHAALQPYPWLTAAALTLAALYALLAEGTAVATARNAFPAAERAQLALLIAPVAGICAIAVALALACTGRHRKGAAPSPGPGSRPGAAPAPARTPGSGKVAGGTPVPGAGATPDHG